MQTATNRVWPFLLTIILGVLIVPAQGFGQSNMWTQTSGPVGGASVNSTLVDGDTIYVATFDRGVWRSYDGGSSWTHLYVPTFFAGDLLKTSYGRLFEANDDGIRFSDDEGESWTEKEFVRGATDLTKGYGLIAARMDEASYEVTDNYVRVSSDSGKTWMQTQIDSAKLVDGMNDLEVVSEDSLMMATTDGVYVMSMNDTTWKETSLKKEVNALEMVDGRIFADMYMSNDMGSSWDSLDSYPMSEMGGLKAAPTGDLYATAPLDSVFHSPDFGSSWSHLTEQNLARLDIRSKAVDQQGNFYLGLYESGLFRYSKDEEKWNIIGAPSTNVLDMYTKSDGNVLAGTERSGINTYNPETGTWSKEYGPYEGNAIGLIDSVGPDSLIMSRQGDLGGQASVHFSDDMGQTWTKTDTGFTAPEFPEEFPDLTATGFAYSESKGMFIGTLEGGVYHSMNGSEWEPINDSLPDGVQDMATGPEDKIFVGTETGLFQWNESSSHWSEVDTSPDSLLDGEIPSIAVHPNGAVIAGRWIRQAGSTSWDTLNMPENDAYYDVEVDLVEISDEGTIYLASWNGVVYKSEDMAESWEAITEGLPDDIGQGIFTDMAFTGDKVLLGVEDRGVYQYSTSSTSIDPKEDELPDRITLKQNYPNPFNPTTNIRYSLPRPVEVELTVYSVLGRRVATLVNGTRKAGTHKVPFNAGNLSSGVYIYQLKAGDYSESQKMLLVK